jgi:hypothetical protein
MPQYSSFSPPDSGRIRCVCDYDDDDGFTIQCEQCLVWQHAKCVGISKNSVPEQYFCEECNPGWHEDLHYLALRAINLDVINTTTNHINQTNVNILEESGSTPVQPRSGFKRKVSMPAGVPALNEISENIVSNDAQPVIEAFLKNLNVQRLKRQQHSQDPNLINFEFQATVVMDSLEHLALLQKNLEVREIRNRGYQKKGTSTKYGLFATEPCDPGHFVCEFIGHVQLKNLLTVKGTKDFPVSVTQSFVLYPLASIDLAVDARKFGTGTRYARRSCRPNVQVKPIIIESSSKDLTLSWGLFARNIIKANSEILLPLDYQCGNGLFKYECACNAPDFCLGPLDNFVVSMKETLNLIAQKPASPKPVASSSAAFAESAELEALGIRRSSSAVLQDSQVVVSTATRPILDSRKLSREERKLQKYIEYFEKMDNADAAKKVVSSSSNSSIGSRKGSSSGSSPQQSSRISSPEKPISAGGLKKAWKHLFSTSGEVESETVEAIQTETTTTVAKPGGAKRGRKPSTTKTQETSQNYSELPQLQATSSPINSNAPSSPLKPKPKSLPKRKKSAQIAIVDENLTEEIDVGSEIVQGGKAVENEAKKPKLSKKLKERSDRESKERYDYKEHSEHKGEHNEHKGERKESNGEHREHNGEHKEQSPQKSQHSHTQLLGQSESNSSPLIDIERSSSVVSAEILQTGPEPVATAPDTPSKKKLSLSDYLKKKKASPAEAIPLNFGEEEGEISSEPAVLNTKQSEFGFLSEAVISRGSLEEGEVDEEHRVSENFNFSSSREFLRQSTEEIPSGLKSGTSATTTGSRNEYKTISVDYKDNRSSEYRSNDYRDSNRDINRDWDRRPPPPSSSQSSRYRDDREKEFDRLQREREFERREAEREREKRERERYRGSERESPPHHERRFYPDHRPAYRPYIPRPYSGSGGYIGHPPAYSPYAHNSHPHNQHPHSHSHQNRPPFNRDNQEHQQGYQSRPPNYRPNNNNFKK